MRRIRLARTVEVETRFRSCHAGVMAEFGVHFQKIPELLVDGDEKKKESDSND